MFLRFLTKKKLNNLQIIIHAINGVDYKNDIASYFIFFKEECKIEQDKSSVIYSCCNTVNTSY